MHIITLDDLNASARRREIITNAWMVLRSRTASEIEHYWQFLYMEAGRAHYEGLCSRFVAVDVPAAMIMIRGDRCWRCESKAAKTGIPLENPYTV